MAKQHVTIAEIWEAEPDQIEKSIEHYRKASQVYRGEEQQSQVICMRSRRKLKSRLGEQVRSESGVHARAQ